CPASAELNPCHPPSLIKPKRGQEEAFVASVPLVSAAKWPEWISQISSKSEDVRPPSPARTYSRALGSSHSLTLPPPKPPAPRRPNRMASCVMHASLSR